MSTITPEDLLKQWKLEQLSVEMAIGHLIQNLVKQQEILHSVNVALAKSDLQIEAPTISVRAHQKHVKKRA